MRGKRAKEIRKGVYGDYSPRHRKYFRAKEGNIVADGLRHAYQKEKKEWK